jgi:peptidoglycan/xylan/chitin deacetylase (PgdA/CDA1 family)
MIWERVSQIALRVAAERGAIVLCFHEISPAKFERWVQGLVAQFELVSMDELVHRRMTGRPLRQVFTLTFDDGWAKTCEPIAAICERRGWPVMIYLVAGLCENPGTLWFAELPAILEDARGRYVQTDDYVLDLRAPRRAERTTERLKAQLKVLPGEVALDVVRRLRVAAGLPSTHAQRPPFVDAAFVRRYAGSKYVAFGSHTVDHQCVAVQSERQLCAQLEQSRSTLEALTGRPVQHFAYPYGWPEVIGPQAPRLVARYHASAVTMVPGVCDERSELAFLPRVSMYEKDTDWRFAAKITLAPWM